MNRRALVIGLGAAAMWPVVARGQQRISIVGFVGIADTNDNSDYESFAKGLSEIGFVDQQDVFISRREVSDVSQIPLAAIDLVQKRVAIICGPSNAILAARAATSEIPLVFIGGRDPVAAGLVSSFNHPGGTVTGVSLSAGDLPTKQIELLHELLPSATKIGWLISPGMTDSEPGTELALGSARKFGIDLIVDPVTKESELETAIDRLAREGANAVQVNGNVFFNSYRDRLGELAASRRLPMVATSRRYTLAGAVMSYGANVPDVVRQAGNYVGRILKGERPADLPVLRPTKFDLVINLKTASALGLTVSPSLLARADEVIE
jgi:ABC-type uncharacterized transport system substrate-binding protein